MSEVELECPVGFENQLNDDILYVCCDMNFEVEEDPFSCVQVQEEEEIDVTIAEDDLVWTGAAAGYLAMGIFNWFLLWGQYALWIVGVIGFTEVQAVIKAFSKLSLDSVSSLTNALRSLAKKFSWPIPAGLLISTFLNAASSWWIMIYYAYESTGFPTTGMFYRTAKGFYYSWWVVGLMQAVLFLLDVFLGTGKLDLYNAILIFGTIGFWTLTVLVLSSLKS